MYVKEIELKGLKRFAHAKIARLKVTDIASTLIIIGANGFGKTSFLKECTPLPAVRTDYESDGHKRIVIEHAGSLYELVSDFSVKSKPHSFLKDTVELNDSGTTQVQIELIEKHLGYTPTIRDILTGNHKFSDMMPSNRKTLLLDHNPAKLDYILEKHKSIYGQLRACINNLTRLYERESLLKSELLDPTLEAQLAKEKDELSELLGKIVEITHRLSEQIRMLSGTSQGTHINILNIQRDVQETYNHMARFKNVPRKDREKHLEKLLRLHQDKKVLLDTIQDQIRSCISEIDRYSKYVEEGNHKEVEEELKKKIFFLKEEIEKLSSVINNPFDEILLDEVPDHVSTLNGILTHFIGCGNTLQTPDKMNRLRIRLAKYHQYLTEYGYKENQSKAKRSSLEDYLNQDGPDPACVSAICPLLLGYRKTIDTIKIDYARTDLEVKWFEHKTRRYQLIVSKLTEKIRSLDMYTPFLNELSSYFSTYAYLRIPIHGLNVIDCLRSQPFVITRKIEEHLVESQKVYQKKRLQAELDLLMTKHAQITSSESVDKSFVTQIIEEKTKDLKKLREKSGMLELSIEELQQDINLIVDYNQYLKTLQDHREMIVKYDQDINIQYSIQSFQKIKDILEEQKIMTATRLSEIDTILKNQDRVRIRYEEEVVKQIKILEEEREKLRKIEEALSPIKGIPHRYMVRFVNPLIDNMNYFISRVFSYDMELKKFDVDQPSNYKFAIKVGDNSETIPDISECSSGQKDMINVAFNFAMAFQMKLHDAYVCSDELDRALDTYHKQQFAKLLKEMIEEHIISQILLVSHHAVFSDSFVDADILVLGEENIVLPETYNRNVEVDYV